jgi:hypothetical protein
MGGRRRALLRAIMQGDPAVARTLRRPSALMSVDYSAMLSQRRTEIEDLVTNQPPAPASAGKHRVEVSRSLVIVAVGVIVVLLALIAILIGGLAQALQASDDGTRNSVMSTTQPSEAAASPTAPPVQPETSPTDTPLIYDVGQTYTVGNVTMTVNSVEVLNSVTTTSGAPLTPDAGGQLVLFKTTYSNSKNQADLSCGDTGLYLQAFDVEGKEMAPVFENSRIPGNPGCNDYLLQNISHEWNFVFQSVAGAVPNALSVTETDTYADPTFVRLR